MHLMLSVRAHASVDDGEPMALAPRDAALLAWLALEGPTPRARLATLLWPDSDADAARNALRQRLFQLRKQVGADLVAGSTTLALAEGVTHDLIDADQVLGDGPSVAAGEFAAWLGQQRQRRQARVRQSLVELAQMAETAGDWADALSHAQELLALDPLSEDAHRRLMRLHYLASDRSAALLAFDRCEQVLKDEVGARPSAETLALLQTIEASGHSAGDAASSRVVPASVLRPPRMVGRDAELAAALSAWQDGRVFCLEGEGGMGKSRLLQEISGRRSGAVIVKARPGDALVPYATLGRLLRALGPRISSQLDPHATRALVTQVAESGGTERLALADAVAGHIESACQAGIDALIIDDLHFADAASLEALLQLLRAPSLTALRWGLARRWGEGPPALDELMDALLEEQLLEPVPLQPLTCEQLADLVAALGLSGPGNEALSLTLHRHTGGNPLFALETLRQAWTDDGLKHGRLPRPVSVTRLIERRVMRLSPAAVRLARCAAVAGVDFSIDLAATVLAIPAIDLADAWSELTQAQVFVEGAFAHDLIYEAVLSGLPEPIAAHLHGEVACQLEARQGEPASIAAHWLAAGTPVRALPFLHRAGEMAAAQRRFREAASAFEREAQLRLAQGDATGAFDAAYSMRQACFQLDLSDRTDAALDLMQRAAGTPQQRASTQAERAIVCMHRGAMSDAERAVDEGLAALEGLHEPGLRSHLHQHLAAVRAWQHRPAEAHALLEAIEHDVEATGDIDRRVEFATGYAVVLEHLDRTGESARWYRRAADLGLAGNRLPGAAQSLLNLAIGQRDSGHLVGALATMHEARSLLESLPDGAVPYSSLDLNFAIILRDMGHYGESLEWFDKAIERGRVHVPGWVPLFLASRAQAWIALGQLARAQQDLDAAASGDAPSLARSRCELVRGHLQRLLGQDASATFDRAHEHLGRNARALSRHRLQLARCSILDASDALAVAGEVLDAAMVSKRVGIAVAARTRLCEAARALGHVAEAARHARQLAHWADGDGSDDTYRAAVWLAAYRALSPVDSPSAAAILARALEWIHTTARDRVPESFRESFLHRNPVNLELLSLAARSARGTGA